MRHDLLRQILRQVRGAQINASAVHTRAAEIADRLAIFTADAEHNDDAARLIFAEEAACSAADDEHGYFLFILLHVDACAVTGIALHVDGTAAHGVACRIARAAVNGDLARIHRVAGRVLCAAIYNNICAVQIRAERVARHFVQYNCTLTLPCADVALAECICFLFHVFPLTAALRAGRGAYGP